MDPIDLPTITYPFQSAIHPAAKKVNERTIAWTDRFGLLPDEPAARRRHEAYGLFAARMYPNAPIDLLDVAADFVAWLHLMDDWTDETCAGREPERLADLHARLGAILAGAAPALGDGKLCRALHDVRSRLAALAPAPWLHQYCRDLVMVLDALRWESENRQSGRPPTVAAYVDMRPYTSGAYPCFALVPIADRIDLPLSLHQHPIVQELSLAANRIVCFANDMFSVDKELRRGDTHNLVIAIRAESCCTLQEALARAASAHDFEVLAFLSLEDRLRSFEPKAASALLRYAAGLRTWIRANLDWSREALRYRPPGKTVEAA